MNYRIFTNYEELVLEVSVSTPKPARIRIKVFDEARPKTVFTNRYKTVSGVFKFYIRMPMTPKNIILQIYNEAVGNQKNGVDNSFRVLKIEKTPLFKRTDVSDIRKPSVKSFVDFAQRFSYNASYLDVNKTYTSQDKQYYIEYLPVIRSTQDNRPLKTPARISKNTGMIQVSQADFDKYTVPMRMAILLHEFSHFYMNENMSDETEADINGLIIYLSLGYPTIEAYEGFLSVFEGTPSEQNVQRYNILDKFIRDFQSNKVVLN